MVDADGTLGDLLLGNATTRSGDLDVEVHTVDTSARVVLDTQIDVLLDTEAEAALVTEVLLLKLVLLDLQALLEDLLGLLASHGDVASNLIVTADTEASDRIASYKVIGN